MGRMTVEEIVNFKTRAPKTLLKVLAKRNFRDKTGRFDKSDAVDNVNRFDKVEAEEATGEILGWLSADLNNGELDFESKPHMDYWWFYLPDPKGGRRRRRKSRRKSKRRRTKKKRRRRRRKSTKKKRRRRRRK